MLFRSQLKSSVARVISDYMIKKHCIEIGTAHTFQGDERDIILASWAYANNSFPQSLGFLQKFIRLSLLLKQPF